MGSPVTTTPDASAVWAWIGRRTDNRRTRVTTATSQQWFENKYECAEERPARFGFVNTSAGRLQSRNLSRQGKITILQQFGNRFLRMPRFALRARLDSHVGLGNRTSNFKNPGGRRDSNPQQPEPQSGALPLSYDHHLLVRIWILKF